MEDSISKVTKLAIFKGKEIRKIIHNNEGWGQIATPLYCLHCKILNQKKIFKKVFIELSEEIGQLQ